MSMEPATLAQFADAALARLEDSFWRVRKMALQTLGKLDPARLAQHANAVVARLEDSDTSLQYTACKTLRQLKPAALAQHAHAVVTTLEDSGTGGTAEHEYDVPQMALWMLGELEPAALAQHVSAVMAVLKDSDRDMWHWRVREAAWVTLKALPRAVTRDVDFDDHFEEYI